MNDSVLIMRVEDMRGVLPPGIHVRFATPHSLWGRRWTTFSTGLAGVVFLPGTWCGQSILSCQVYDPDGELKAHYDIPFQIPHTSSSVLALRVQPSSPSWWRKWVRDFLIKGIPPSPATLARRILHINQDDTLNEQSDLLAKMGGRRLDLEEHDDVTKNSCQKSDPSSL